MFFIFEEMESEPNPVIRWVWYEMGEEDQALLTQFRKGRYLMICIA